MPERGQDVTTNNDLTVRDLQVLERMTWGYTDKRIAAELLLARRTVSNRVSRMYLKMNVSGRAEAVAQAVANGWATYRDETRRDQ